MDKIKALYTNVFLSSLHFNIIDTSLADKTVYGMRGAKMSMARGVRKEGSKGGTQDMYLWTLE